MKKTLPLIILALCLLATLSKAANVYVSTSSALAAACSSAVSGDIIYISAGTYDGPFVLSNKNNVQLRSYNGTVILRGNSNPATSGIKILLIENSSNITVNGLVFTRNWGNFADGIHVRGSGDGIYISNCEFYDIGWSTSKSTLPTSGENAHAIVVVGSSSTAYSNIFIGGNTIHDCITGYSESLTIGGNVNNFLIEGNTLYSNTNIGIDLMGHFSWTGAPTSVNYARNGIVRENVVRDYAGPAALDAAGGIYIDGGSNITIENNTVYNYKVGISVGCETPSKSNTGNIVRNNLVYNCSLSGLFLGSNTTSVVYNTKVTGNTFYKNGYGTYDNGQIALQNNSGSIINNNILYPTNGRLAMVQMSGTTSSSPTINYNLFYRDNGSTSSLFYGITTATNSVLANPLFVNASANNFHLQSTSPAINAGDPSFVAASGEEDIDGTSRVQNGRVDIGVDEVAVSSGVSITVDGNASDWASVSAISTSGSGGLTSLKAHDNSTTLYLLAQGTTTETYYQVFIDTDNDATGSNEYTGSAWSSTGFNYMIENGTLYHYNGTGTNWAWTSLGSVSASKTSTVIEIGIPKSLIGSLSSTIRVAAKTITSAWANAGAIPTGTTGSPYTTSGSSGARMASSEEIATSALYEITPGFSLSPNPAKAVTKITYTVEEKMHVAIDVFDLQGRKISSVLNQVQEAGAYEHTLQTPRTGMYLVRINRGGRVAAQRLVVE